ncbi:MAG: tRNA (guanosine(37)-N1)-methyltransferase TrmD [Pseudomonadota bacterium]
MTDAPKPRSAGMLRARPTAQPRPLMAERERPHAFAATVLTLFPEMFPGPLGHSLMGKALKDGHWALNTLDIRRFATDRHRSVDDTPSGGGAGMVMRADVLARAIDTACHADHGATARRPALYLSPRGRPFDQAMAHRLAAGPGVILLCGRYEGVDQRVLDARGLIEVSMGDYVLSGGEIAAMALLDATLRLRPGILGNAASVEEESFAQGLLEHPHYTRPQVWEGREIPEVLTSGHHDRIARWRRAEAERLTRERRPDLWAAYRAGMPPSDEAPAGQTAVPAARGQGSTEQWDGENRTPEAPLADQAGQAPEHNKE